MAKNPAYPTKSIIVLLSVVCKYKALCQSEVVKICLGVSHPVLQEQENTQAKYLVQR